MSEKAGRPTAFNKKIAEEICIRLMQGESLRKILAADEMPAQSTVYLWLIRAKEEKASKELKLFSEQYAQARRIQAEGYIDEVMDIADDGSNDWMEKFDKDGQSVGWMLNGEHVQRSRVRIDTRKWIASKLVPKVYGDKIQQELSGPDGEPIQTKATVITAEPMSIEDWSKRFGSK